MVRPVRRAELFKARLLIGIGLLLPLVWPGPGMAARTLADQKDKEIHAILKASLPVAEKLLGEYHTDAVVVYDQLAIEATARDHKEVENRIWWVSENGAEDLANYVRDFPPGQKVEKVRAFLIRAGKLDRKAALEAEIQRLDDDRIHVQKGDDDRATNVVIAFDAALPGDVLGVSIETKVDDPLNWRSFEVADFRPVAHAELYFKNNRYVTYSLFGHRFPKGMIRKQVLEEKKGHVREIKMWAQNIEPILDEPYSPPRHLQSPRFLVIWRAVLEDLGDGKSIWWRFEHWNQVALFFAGAESDMLATRRMAEQEAHRIAAGRDANREVADELYMFVRDELLDISGQVYSDDEQHGVDGVLATRAGSEFEKATLLLAMLRSQGLLANTVWAHHPDNGSFFAKYPVWSQLDHPLVVVKLGKKQRWYDVGCKGCAPGELRPELRSTTALSYRPDILSLDADLRESVPEQAWLETRDPYELYLSQLIPKKWSDLIQTPGDPKDFVGWVDETVRFSAGTPEAEPQVEYLLQTSGLTDTREAWHASVDKERFAADRILDRLPMIEDGQLKDPQASSEDTLRVYSQLDCPPLPAPAGDSWILPAELVYGDPVIGRWPDERTTPFHVGRSTERRWTTSIPLPEGWEEVVLPSGASHGVDRFRYRIDFLTHDGHFVVKRRIEERAGLVADAEALQLIGEEAKAIYEQETTALVLKRRPRTGM